MHKHFQLHVGAFLADFFNLVQAQFARQDDAGNPHFLPELHRHEVGGIGLHREVNRHFGPLLAHLHDQAGVGHDERVRAHGNDGFDVAQVGAHLVVVRQQVAGQKKFLAARVRFFDALLNLFNAKFVVARAQAVARLAGVHRVGAVVVGGAHPVERASGQKEFGGGAGHGG